MRTLLALSVFLLFSYNAIAEVGEPRRCEVKAVVMQIPAATTLDGTVISAVNEINLAILYKMKENIIRRELSFTPKKKWMKWA